jgi:hypothetical protein
MLPNLDQSTANVDKFLKRRFHVRIRRLQRVGVLELIGEQEAVLYGSDRFFGAEGLHWPDFHHGLPDSDLV